MNTGAWWKAHDLMMCAARLHSVNTQGTINKALLCFFASLCCFLVADNTVLWDQRKKGRQNFWDIPSFISSMIAAVGGLWWYAQSGQSFSTRQPAIAQQLKSLVVTVVQCYTSHICSFFSFLFLAERAKIISRKLFKKESNFKSFFFFCFVYNWGIIDCTEGTVILN